MEHPPTSTSPNPEILTNLAPNIEIGPLSSNESHLPLSKENHQGSLYSKTLNTPTASPEDPSAASPKGLEDIEEDGDLEVIKLKADSEINTKVYENALLGQILTDEELPQPQVKSILAKKWLVKGKLDFIFVEKNLYIFVFENPREKNRIERNNPWSVLNYNINLKPFPKGKTIKDVDFSTMLIWIQAQNLPPNLATSENAEVIAGKFPICEDIQIKKCSGVNWDGIIRMRVAIELDRALKTGYRVEADNGALFDINIVYERLKNFCYNCGRVAHLQKACPRIVPVNASKRLGPWLRADYKQKPHLDEEKSHDQMQEESSLESQSVSLRDKNWEGNLVQVSNISGNTSSKSPKADEDNFHKRGKRKDKGTEGDKVTSPKAKRSYVRKSKTNSSLQPCSPSTKAKLPLVAPPFDVYNDEKVKDQIDYIVKGSTFKETITVEEKERVCKILDVIPDDGCFTTLKPDAIIEEIGKQRFGDINPDDTVFFPDREKNQVQPTKEYIQWLKEKKTKEQSKAGNPKAIIATAESQKEDLQVVHQWEKELKAPGSASRAIVSIKKSARLKIKEEEKRKRHEDFKYQKSCMHPEVLMESISPTLKLKGDKLVDAEKIDELLADYEMGRPIFPAPIKE